MEGTIQSSEKIFQFLNGIGYEFANERGMMEYCRNGKNLLKVIVEVIKNFQPAYLRSILAVQCHRISEDLDRHRESLPFISDFLTAKEVFKTTGFELRMIDIVHLNPNPIQNTAQNREIAILSHLYLLWHWHQDVIAKNEYILSRHKILIRDNRSLIQQQSAVDAEVKEVDRQKIMERPAFLEKTKLISDCKEEIGRLRVKKNEVLSLRMERERELLEKGKEQEDCLYRIHQLEMHIAQAKKELSINAPEVRKEKQRQDLALHQGISRQQRLFQYATKMRGLLKKRMSALELNLSKLKNLAPIEHLDNRYSNLNTLRRRMQADDQLKRGVIGRLQQQNSQLAVEEQEEEHRQGKEGQRIGQLRILRGKLMHSLEGRKGEVKKVGEGNISIQGMVRNTKNEIEQNLRRSYQSDNLFDNQLRKLSQQHQEWKRKVMTMLYNSHLPFNMNFFGINY